jgi:hypothetical protein
MRVILTCFGLMALLGHQPITVAASLCKPLRKFLESVAPKKSQTVTFRTSWGDGFKDSEGGSEEIVFGAKRCEHENYGPAKDVCAYLMEHGVMEFSGNNAKDAIACLSPKTRFASGVSLNGIALHFTYGTDHRGSLVAITFAEDTQVGGMALTIKADGY